MSETSGDQSLQEIAAPAVVDLIKGHTTALTFRIAVEGKAIDVTINLTHRGEVDDE